MSMETNDIPVFEAVRNAVKKAQMIKKCHVCEAVLAEDSQFCEECGTPILLNCTSCGKEVGRGKSYCRYCGAKF